MLKNKITPFQKYAAMGFLAFAASWANLAAAQTQAPVVVMDSTTFDIYSTYEVSMTEWRGPAFTTGAIATQISEITLGLSSTPDTAATLRLFQLDDTTELPVGAALASTTLPIVTDNDDANMSANTYTAAQLGSISNTQLLPNKKYTLMVSKQSDDGYIALSDFNDSGNLYTYDGGFSVAAEGYLQTQDAGTSWVKNRYVTPALRLTVVPFEEPIEIDPPQPKPTPTPVPGLGAVGLVSLVSIMGWMGLRRTRGRRS